MTAASLKLVRTNSEDKDFQLLVRELDKELAFLDGDDHGFYAQYNKIDAIKHVVVGYSNDEAVACGAVKKFDNDCLEIKRMYVLPAHRGKGFASDILNELENWSRELGFQQCILETGKRQKEALRLYERAAMSYPLITVNTKV